MTTLAPAATFTPNPEYVASKTSEKDEQLALAILQAVAPVFRAKYTDVITGNETAMDAGLAFAAMCEVMWRWTYSEQWPLPAPPAETTTP